MVVVSRNGGGCWKFRVAGDPSHITANVDICTDDVTQFEM